MNLGNTLRIAFRALAKNKMRAALTVLGVVIGIAAVTTMVSVGQSAAGLVQGQFESLGTNVVMVMPAARERGGVRQGRMVSLTADDSAAIAEECPSVSASSPAMFHAGQVIYGNANWNPKQMLGVGEQYATVRNMDIARGEFLTQEHLRSAAKVAVIGQTLVVKLFQTTDPIGERIRLNSIPFEVIGVLEEAGSNMVGDDQDDVVLVPVTTMQKRLLGSPFRNVHMIMASARSSELSDRAEFEIRNLLLDRHRVKLGEDADFEVKDTAEIAAALGVVTGAMTLMLSSIAGISLLVGGVGIMNTMLVSVTERTREIGIRMAVGAESRDILLQFLVESVVLSIVGGLVGFALGVGGSVAITMTINHFSTGTDWPVVISLSAAVVAIVFAAVVGIFFGFYPALKASRLDPIDALRYE